MKNIFLSLFFFLTIHVYAQVYYEVVEKKADIVNRPDLNAEIIGQVSEHDLIEVTAATNGWAAIKYQSKKAYIELISIKPLDKSIENVMSSNTETKQTSELTSDNILKAETEISITPMSEILARKVKVGQNVLFSVVHDVTVGDKVVIRAGTTISGVIIERKSSRNYGAIKRIKLYREGNSLGVLQIRIDNILYNEQSIQLVNNIVSAPQLPYNKAKQKWYDKGHDWSKVLKRSDLIPLGHVLTLQVASDIKI